MPAQAELLHGVIGRMFDAPTAQRLAQQFFDEGGAVVVELIGASGAELTEAEARCVWDNGAARLSLQEAYIRQGRDVLEQTLPAVMAHELLGHGLWQARADREDASVVLRHHHLSEVYARLVGWLVDIELDGHISSDSTARDFLKDPDVYWDQLKLRTVYYALTFSTAELQNPISTLVVRAAAARSRRDELARMLSNIRSWPAVIDHFVANHGIDELRMREVRDDLAQDDRGLQRDVANVEAVIAELDLCIERFRAETDGQSERYLQQAAQHSLLTRLAGEVAILESRLRNSIDQCAHDPFAAMPSERHRNEKRWRDQIDFATLKAMYLEDRQRHPEHWRP
jgi:hypothetical protein